MYFEMDNNPFNKYIINEYSLFFSCMSIVVTILLLVDDTPTG